MNTKRLTRRVRRKWALRLRCDADLYYVNYIPDGEHIISISKNYSRKSG